MKGPLSPTTICTCHQNLQELAQDTPIVQPLFVEIHTLRQRVIAGHTLSDKELLKMDNIIVVLQTNHFNMNQFYNLEEVTDTSSIVFFNPAGTYTGNQENELEMILMLRDLYVIEKALLQRETHCCQ